MTAVRSFQRKLEVFKEDLQGNCEHFPNVQEQIQGERDFSPHVDFMDRLIGNVKRRFDSFSLGQQLLLIQNPFLITDVRGFSKEVTQTVMWAHAGSLQMELIDLQANVALRACSHRQLFFQVRVDVLHYIPMKECFCKKILGAFKNTAARVFFLLLWVVFKFGKVQLARKKHQTSGSFLTADQ